MGGIGAAAVLAQRLSQEQMPAEYATLKAVLTRLSKSNDLGSHPIVFSVGTGGYTAHLAYQRGLCKEDQCSFFAQLNPYKSYNPEWDELIRQGYLLGDIQGWSASSGAVVLPRATFRAYGSRTEYLPCTVAHEISHYLRQHFFKQSYYKHHNLSESDEKKAETELRRWGREQELEADRDAADMLARAGYPARVCQHEIDFMHRSVGDGSKTEETSTHPGYWERLAAIRSHYDELEKKTVKPQMGPAAVFEYDPVDNYLTVSSLDK